MNTVTNTRIENITLTYSDAPPHIPQVGFATRNIPAEPFAAAGSGYWRPFPNNAQQVVYNRGGGFDASTSVFTAPVTGRYLFVGLVTLSALQSGALIAASLWKNGGCCAMLGQRTIANIWDESIGGSIVEWLEKDETAEIRYYYTVGSAVKIDPKESGWIRFSGDLIGV